MATSGNDHQYGAIAAHHYRAYRPPLHAMILSQALTGQHFDTAVDVGCGTGWSTRALTAFANTIIGIDSSAEMLAAAEQAVGIEYRLSDGSRLPVDAHTIDLVSIAGALPYLKRPTIDHELQRICRPSATILAYDFKIDLAPLAQLLDVDLGPSTSDYDHAANLSNGGLFTTQAVAQKRVRFQATTGQACHVLLSSERRFRQLAKCFDTSDPFAIVLNKLAAIKPKLELEATTWFALHGIRTGV